MKAANISSYFEVLIFAVMGHGEFHWHVCKTSLFPQALFSIDELESASLAVCQYLASAAAAKRASLGTPLSASLHEPGVRYLDQLTYIFLKTSFSILPIYKNGLGPGPPL